MAGSKASGTLELDQDEHVQRRAWRFERFGWGVLGLVLVAALLGAFGGGPLAFTSASSPDGGVVTRHERVVRHGAQTEIEVRLPPGGAADTLAVVSLDAAYVDAMGIERVWPEPLQVSASAGRVEYQLRRREPAQPMRVVFMAQPGTVGVQHVSLGTSRGPIPIRQLVLP